MEILVDAVTAVCSDDTAVLLLGMLLNNVTKLADQNTGLDSLDGFIQALAGGLDDSHGVGVGLGLVANIVGFVEVGVVTLVEQANVNVKNVAIDKNSLIGDSVADDFVDGCTTGLGEVIVVQGGRI